jgi:hypothetical protein
MARKKNNDYVRTLNKIAGGKSFSITLPISIIREMEWRSSQQVCIKKWGNKILIQDYNELLKKNQSC